MNLIHRARRLAGLLAISALLVPAASQAGDSLLVVSGKVLQHLPPKLELRPGAVTFVEVGSAIILSIPIRNAGFQPIQVENAAVEIGFLATTGVVCKAVASSTENNHLLKPGENGKIKVELPIGAFQHCQMGVPVWFQAGDHPDSGSYVLMDTNKGNTCLALQKATLGELAIKNPGARMRTQVRPRTEVLPAVSVPRRSPVRKVESALQTRRQELPRATAPAMRRTAAGQVLFQRH